MSGEPAEEPYELRTTSTVRRALSEALPSFAAAAYEVHNWLCWWTRTGSGRGCFRRWTTGSALAVVPTG